MADLEVREITKQYPSAAEPLTILNGVSFELSAGENLVVLGPSGCGKSTLLHILGTLEKPSEGTVSLAGQNPFGLSESRLATFRNEQIGFIFQDHHLLPQCTALENVLIPTIAQGNASDEQVNRARELLDRVGLKDRLDHRPAELSGGERQRTAIARALILKPTLLLADEPTGNLDHQTAETVADLLVELQQHENTMMVLVTHSSGLARRFQRQTELLGGKLHDLSRAGV